MSLSAFMAQNALKPDRVKYIASKRFVDDEGSPVEWEIVNVSSSDDEALRRSCTKRVQIPGKRGQFTQETDYNQYLGRLAARCTAYPNLDDADLQNSYGVMGADNLLKAMLLPGEYAEYLTKVQEVNGFDTSFDDQVDEVKN